MASDFTYFRRVEFSDTDTAGLIHFSAMLRYMEEAEHAFYRSLGLPGYEWTEDQVFGIPRVLVTCEFLAPLRYGEEVEVYLVVREVRTKAIRYEARFTREDESERTLVARGAMTVVCATRKHGERDWVGTEIPQDLRDQINPVS